MSHDLVGLDIGMHLLSMRLNEILLCCVWNGKHDYMVGGGLAWELNAWYGMWILLVKEFQGKLLVMVVSVYLDIGDV